MIREREITEWLPNNNNEIVWCCEEIVRLGKKNDMAVIEFGKNEEGIDSIRLVRSFK